MPNAAAAPLTNTRWRDYTGFSESLMNLGLWSTDYRGTKRAPTPKRRQRKMLANRTKVTERKSKVPTCIALYHEQDLSRSVHWHVLTRITVLPATHTFIHKWNEPCLPLFSMSQSVTALWPVPVLYIRPAEVRRLSWPKWLGTRWFTARRRSPTQYSQHSNDTRKTTHFHKGLHSQSAF